MDGVTNRACQVRASALGLAAALMMVALPAIAVWWLPSDGRAPSPINPTTRPSGLPLQVSETDPTLAPEASRRSARYEQCVSERGLEVTAMVVVNRVGRPQGVSTDREVPAEIHRPCFLRIGGGLLANGVTSWDRTARMRPPGGPQTSIVAQRLVDFSRGHGRIPALAPRLELLLGDMPLKGLSRARAAEPSEWALCAPYAERSCPMSALATLEQAHTSRIVGAPSACTATVGPLPPHLRITRIKLAERTATIEAPGDLDCSEYWAVRIWVDKAGRLAAVNLLLGSP